MAPTTTSQFIDPRKNLLADPFLADLIKNPVLDPGVVPLPPKPPTPKFDLFDRFKFLDLPSLVQNLPTVKPAATNSLGDPKLDGLVNEIVKTNSDIDSLLADYQKAVNGELKDANGNKVDPFVIQTKLQQAMQRRLELITLLSNIQKMDHDAKQVVNNNIR